MRAIETLKTFTGSVIVYAVVASCSADHAPLLPVAGTGGEAMIATGGASMTENGGGATAQADASSNAAGGSPSAAGAASNGAGGAKNSGGMMNQMMNPVPPAKADPVSGSRLRAKYVTGSDGAKQVLGWYDNQRNEDCSFSTASDGKMRCMPYAGLVSAGSYFSDAGCTAPLAAALKSTCTGMADAKYVSLPSAPGTCVGLRLAALGAPATPTDVYTGTTANCIMISGASVTMSFNLYAVGAAVDPSAFVAGTTSVE